MDQWEDQLLALLEMRLEGCHHPKGHWGQP